jgi:hypothetical protein
MVLPGKYIHGMEVQVDHILVVDPRETCAPLFPLHILPDIDHFRIIVAGSGKSILWLLSFVRVHPEELTPQLAPQSSKT